MLLFKSFLSAKKSCEKYENALISVRNNMYAKFQDGFTNYLQDNLAKIIKRNSKDTNTMATAFNSMATAHTKNVTDRKLTKEKAKASIKTAEREVKKIEQDAELADIDQEIAVSARKRQQKKEIAKAAKEDAEELNNMVTSKTPELLRLCNNEADNRISGETDIAKLNKIPGEVGKLKVCAWGTILNDIGISGTCVKGDRENYVEKTCAELKGFDIAKKVATKVQEIVASTVTKDKDGNTTMAGFSDTPLFDSETQGQLAPGTYKVVIAGGAGGRGGGQDGCDTIEGKDERSKGGQGALETHIISLKETTKFTATIGQKGADQAKNSIYYGGYSGQRAPSGGDGGSSSITVGGTTYEAKGGKGGEGVYAYYQCKYKVKGSDGANGGNGKNKKDNGYVKIFAAKN